MKTLPFPCVLVLICSAFLSLAQSPPVLFVDDGASSQMRLSWTNTAVGFVVEEVDQLPEPGPWSLLLQAPQLANQQFSVVLGTATGARFFRLTNRPAGLPPDPSFIALPVATGVATLLGEATAFLYTGPNPIQTGVTPGAIEAKRAAVVRGSVRRRDNTPLAGVAISILGHPEFGQTFSRADGMFDMAVNGGGLLTVDYDKTGFCPIQRQIYVPWQDYVTVADVVMIQMDPVMTTVALGINSPMQVHQGSMQTDGDGARKSTLLFTPGTSASLVLADGSTQAVSSLTIRVTEFTVGANGPAMMPAELPPASGYTYCAELSADEAMALGATIQFDRPVFNYVENFLGFPVGMAVPVGFYDRMRAVWVPSLNGRVIEILGITGGFADVDTNGDGSADTGEGITGGERQQLATLYAAGQTLWRVPITHFTPWDYNWPYGPPDDATGPNQPLNRDGSIDDGRCEEDGSIIEAQNQILGKTIGVVGTPFTLNYRSDRSPGRSLANTFEIPLSGANVPVSLKRIELEIQVAGRVFTQTFPAAPNQSTSFTWDGKDAYGRPMQGGQHVAGSIGFVYDASYLDPSSFELAFSLFGGAPIVGSRARQEITISQTFVKSTGPLDAREHGLGGWTLNVHHAYDPVGQILYLGSGSRRNGLNGNLNKVISSVAGNGVAGFSGDGGPASQAQLSAPFGVTTAPDGSLYISDQSNHRVRRVRPDGIIATVAGTGIRGFSGDGGPADQAQLDRPSGVAIAPDGSLYISDQSNHRVRRVGPDGIIATAAGTGIGGFSGDGGTARQAQLNNPQGVATAPDGSLYIAELQTGRVRRVGPDGIITTVAGNGTFGSGGDGGPASQAQLNTPIGVAIGSDGSLYISDRNEDRVRRVGPDGIITTVAGNGTSGSSGDGGLASQAQVDNPQGVGIAPDGSLYITDQGNRIRRVGPDGIITTVAGNGASNGFDGDDGPASQARLNRPSGVAIAPDGSLFITDQFNHRVRRVAPLLPGFSGGDTAVASENGGLLYQFDESGRHLSTRDTLTGAALFEFGYDAEGRLNQVTEKTGGTDNVTTIQHDANGNPTAIISPFGQATTLDVDANGFLSRIDNPAAETYQITYTSSGLLTSFTDARDQTATYQYDSLGRLFIASDSCCGTQTFARTNFPSSNIVTRTTTLGRVTTYAVQNLSNGDQRLVNTFPDDTRSMLELRQDGTQIASRPDGTVSTALLGPDPRFGMAAAMVRTNIVSLPSGLALTNASASNAVLADAADPLSLMSLTRTTTVDGRTAVNTYTAATRTFVNTTPAGRVQTTTLDELGRFVQLQRNGLDPVSVSYENRGRLESLSMGSGTNTRSLSFTYNDEGYVDTLTDSSGRSAHFAYDGAGRVSTKTLPDGRILTLGYDRDGNLTSLTPPGQPAHTLGYSDRNELTLYTPPSLPGTGPTTFVYDADRALSTVNRAGAQTVTIGNDAAGRPVTRTLTSGGEAPTTDTFSYDAAGRITNIVAASGVSIGYSYDGVLPTGQTWSGPIAGSVTHTYDSTFRRASQSVNGTNTIVFSYDNDGLLTGAGNLVIVRDPQHGLPSTHTLGVVSSTLTYNGFGEVTNDTVSASDNPVYRSDFNRDGLGRISRKIDTIGGTVDTFTYSYDAVSQLTRVSRNGATVESYAYDQNGNRTNATVNGATVDGTYDDQDRLTRYGGVTYNYNAAGDLVSKANGVQATMYNYDALGNLLDVTLPDTTAISYLIDGENRRVGKKVNGTLVKGFLYGDTLKPVAELDGTGMIVSRFIYAGSNSPEVMIKGGITHRIITDHLGSVRLVVDSVTGAIVQRMDYDSFGNVVSDTNPGFQPFGFAGGLYDPDTGLIRFGARDYDSTTGRWTSKDPIGFSANDPNLYRYCLNNPVNSKDSTGLEWEIPTSLLLHVTWPTESGMSLLPAPAEPEDGQSLVRRPFERPDRAPAPTESDVCYNYTERIIPVESGMLFPELMVALENLLGRPPVPPARPVMGGPRG